ncbi:Fe-S cluster assembly protein SufD, partial [Streptomyces nigra]
MAEAQNIPVGSTTAGSIAVAAESTVVSRMSAPPSFDVADFPVPHGRGEGRRRRALRRRAAGVRRGDGRRP